MRAGFRPGRRWIPYVAATLAFLGVTALPLPARNVMARDHDSRTGCNLDAERDNVKHVISIQFDNTHFTRDNPNVPSDLEQMPHLLGFLERNGVVLTNHHTPLIAHTATDILTTLTGVYPDRHGVPVSNSFRYFNANGTSSSAGSFAYWTDPVSSGDTAFNMLSALNTNAPAPWVPYTRAGCNVGSVGVANTALENIGGDITTVFGPNSTEAAEAASNPGLAGADFEGIAIHCGRDKALCDAKNAGVADSLPNEPGGYAGFNGLFGHKFVAPQISPTGPLTDINGQVIKDDTGNVGFPGFGGMFASVSLGYVAAMQEHGVPVTYAYMADAHDNHVTDNAFGPGEAGYVAQLKQEDAAFAAFFERLDKDGITARNTLFIVTSDEGDHFVGGPPSPAGCDGVHTPCTYAHIGEISGNLTGLLATEPHITTPFAVHADTAPNFYITGNPAQDAAVTRAFERGVDSLHAVNPLTGKDAPITNSLADQTEMKLLHMVSADPRRTPTFTMFADPDYFLFAGAPNCTQPCVSENPGFAWNHGDVGQDINTTWLGIAGPGVRARGVDHAVWSDHTDVRPTMLALLGLRDDYRSDGRVLMEVLHDWAVAPEQRDTREDFLDLARVYKQINAPVGELSLTSLKISTAALASSAPSDATFTALEAQLAAFTARRNVIAGRISALLNGASFRGHRIQDEDARELIRQANALLDDVKELAAAN